MAVNQRLQLQVSAAVRPEPFWAFTQEPIRGLGPGGVQFSGGVVPYDKLRVGREVYIREVNVDGKPMPSIVMSSLFKRRFF